MCLFEDRIVVLCDLMEWNLGRGRVNDEIMAVLVQSRGLRVGRVVETWVVFRRVGKSSVEDQEMKLMGNYQRLHATIDHKFVESVA